MPDVIYDTNGKLSVGSYHMWRLYPTRITTRSSCRVCIQTVGYAFKISRVLIQDVDPSFTLCCVCEVGWLPIVQVFVAALRCQSCFCIKTIQSEAKAPDVIRLH